MSFRSTVSFLRFLSPLFFPQRQSTCVSSTKQDRPEESDESKHRYFLLGFLRRPRPAVSPVSSSRVQNHEETTRMRSEVTVLHRKASQSIGVRIADAESSRISISSVPSSSASSSSSSRIHPPLTFRAGAQETPQYHWHHITSDQLALQYLGISGKDAQPSHHSDHCLRITSELIISYYIIFYIKNPSEGQYLYKLYFLNNVIKRNYQ